MFPKWYFPTAKSLEMSHCPSLPDPLGVRCVTLWDWMRTLTLWKRVGLHDIQESVHHVEQDPYRSRFVVGQCLVNSRRHITEIQLSRGWESPRLRLLLEFAGRQKHPQQQEDPGLPHRAQNPTGRQMGLKWVTQRGVYTRIRPSLIFLIKAGGRYKGKGRE